jgi:hypothetical protein
VRLRPLTEAECYVRCYGGRQVDSVKVVRPAGADAGSGAAREGLENRVETAEELEAA